jgi:hypothetical protein
LIGENHRNRSIKINSKIDGDCINKIDNTPPMARQAHTYIVVVGLCRLLQCFEFYEMGLPSRISWCNHLLFWHFDRPGANPTTFEFTATTPAL